MVCSDINANHVAKNLQNLQILYWKSLHGHGMYGLKFCMKCYIFLL